MESSTAASPAPVVAATPATTGTSFTAPSNVARAAHEPAANVAEKTKLVKQRVNDLVLWHHPVQSAIALGSLLTVAYASAVYSPVRLATFLLASATFANLVFVNLWVVGGSFFVNVNEQGGIKKPPTMWFLDQTHRHPLRHQHVREWVDFVVDGINITFSQLASIIAIDDNLRSIKALALTTTVYFLSACISTPVLLATAAILGFTTPKIYQMFQPQIDAQVHTVCGMVSKHTKGLTDAAEKYFESARIKAKGRVEAAKAKVKKAE